MPLISAEPILHVRAELADILQFGRTPVGERRVINILGGTVTGKLNGKICLLYTSPSPRD